MVIILFWVLSSLLVGLAGTDKSVGFWGSFLLSLLLSPLIGLIIVAFSGIKQAPSNNRRTARSRRTRPR